MSLYFLFNIAEFRVIFIVNLAQLDGNAFWVAGPASGVGTLVGGGERGRGLVKDRAWWAGGLS